MNYYQRNIGDYARDAGHLSMLEDGAYMRLMDRYYHKERGIPEAETYRLCRARTDEERAAVDAVLREFFRLENGVWVKNKIEEELERAKQAIEVARENGKRGGRPPKPKPNPEKTQPFSKQNPDETQKKAPNHQPPTSKEQEQKKGRASAPAPLACPDGVTDQTWADWLALRRAKKAPVTETVLTHAVAESKKAGLTLEEFLRVWCGRGSQGLEADWLKPNERGPPAVAQPGKNMSAILKIQERQRERLAADGNRTGDQQAALPGPGRPAGGGAD